jgi:hypothetical protein
LAGGTVHNFYKPVKLFCDTHDIDLSWKKMANILPAGRKFANDRAPTLEEIQTIIEYPDRRIKPLVLTTSSSGIRVGAWEYLKWKHIEPIKRDDKVIAAKIIVYAGDNEQYFSFITPEAFQSIQEWMDYRKKSGEDVNGESWIMRTLWNTTTPHSSPKIPRRTDTEAVKALLKRALKSQGLRTAMIAHRHEFKTSHGFRKFFQTNAESKMKSLCVKTLMGQDTGLANSYYKPTVEELLEEYLKAVDNLTINKEIGSQQHEEMIKNQQALAADIQVKDREILELRQRMSKMQQAFESHDARLSEIMDNVKQYRDQRDEGVRKF